MKQILSFLGLAIFLLCCAGEASSQDSELQFVELHRGYYMNGRPYTKKQTKIITSQADYEAELAFYWNETPTSVDFSTGKVLLVDMGMRSNGGYSISVTSVHANTDGFVTANVELLKPGSRCFTTQALTNPYQFVYIPSLEEILVTETVRVNRCRP